MSTTYYLQDLRAEDEGVAERVRVGYQCSGWRFMHQGGTGVTTREEWETWITVMTGEGGLEVVAEHGEQVTAAELVTRTAGRAQDRSAVTAYHSDAEADRALGVMPGDYWQDPQGHDFTRRGEA